MRVPATGSDELSRLADNINIMLARLAQSESKLLKSEQRYRAIVKIGLSSFAVSFHRE
jgi:hypothetical protein